MANLADLPNIGPHLAERLMEAGVEASEDLVALGAERAWLKVRTIDPGACLHMLYALEGAVRGIPKKELDPARKQQLKEFANASRPADAGRADGPVGTPRARSRAAHLQRREALRASRART